MKNNMKLAENWENPKILTQFLARSLKLSRLSLVVGSGISSGLKLPDWQSLLDSLSKGKKLPNDFDEISSPQKATLIKRNFYNNDETKFNLAVKDNLYHNAKIDFDIMQQNKLLSAIGALVMASSRGSISNVITFNFDDILEIYLSYYGFSCESCVSSTSWASNKDVIIHHPHGLLPFGKDKKPQGELIFDHSSFHSIMTNERGWKQKLFQILSSSLVIFIGVSGNDDHLQNHLEECKNIHASLNDNLPYWGIWFTDDAQSAKADIWRSQKVHPIEVIKDEYGETNWDSIPKFLASLY